MITQALFTFLLSTDFLNIYPICKGVILQIRNNQAVKSLHYSKDKIRDNLFI